MAYPYQIESNMTAYSGSMEAEVREVGGFAPRTVIRTDQDFNVIVRWQMVGALSEWLNATFELKVFLERMGIGSDYNLPEARVLSRTGTLTPVSGVPSRRYEHAVHVAAGTVEPGIYKVSVALHLYDNDTPNYPTPVAGYAEAGTINIFVPA